MSAPTQKPADIERQLEQLAYGVIPELIRTYAWAFGLRYEASRRGGQGGKGSDPTDAVVQAICQCASPTREHPHPPKCGRCKARALIDQAAQLMLDGRANLVGALAMLERGLRAADAGAGGELPSQHDTRIPRSITRTEHAEALVRQAQRIREGGGYGAA